MTVRAVIEAECPKAAFRAFSRVVTIARLRQVLEPLGFIWEPYPEPGELIKVCGQFLYGVSPDGNGGAKIRHFRKFRDNQWTHQETCFASNLDYLLRHLRLFRVTEAETPKHTLQQLSRQFRYEKCARGSCRIWAHDGSYIEYSVELSGTPVVKNLIYGEKVPEEGFAPIGLRLLNAAYDYSRTLREYRIRVSTGTTRFRRSNFVWDVSLSSPNELGNLIHATKEGVTGASGAVRYITLESEDLKMGMRRARVANFTDRAVQNENVMTLDPRGGLKLDKRPKAPHSIWTYQRKDKAGQPEPYRRTRTLPNGKSLEMFVAYRKDHAPSKLLSLVKKYGPEVAKLALWAADDLAHALEGKGVTVVLPLPSASPLARRLARLIATRLNARFEDRVSKTGSVRSLPISRRSALAPKLYSVSGRFDHDVVCLVDDYIVTASSMRAAAIHAYRAGAWKVVGAALAI